MANDLDRFVKDPFVLPHDPCVSASDLDFPVDEPLLFAVGLSLLAKAGRQHAKALFPVAEDVCRLPEGLLSFTECGCRVSEVLCSPVMDLCVLAKDLGQVAKDLVPRTTDLDQEAEDLVWSPKGLREEPKDLVLSPKDLREEPKAFHQESTGVSSVAEDIRRYSRVLVEETTVLY